MTASKLGLSPERIARCRSLARQVADGVRRETEKYTTVSTERTVLRLLGVDGVDAEEVPIPNRAVDALAAAGKLARGAAVWLGSALAQGAGGVADAAPPSVGPEGAAAVSEHPRWRDALPPHVERGLERIRGNRAERERRLASHPPDELPLLYAIVATGNIHEDVVQAQAAARAGAQCIAVIRSTAQSLLDHVPYGATTSGFGGTFATQENFRLMRAALDAIEDELGRYVRLVNYCSGLCMPEIAAMGALERLDMMLNDALYGIIFRDINPLRTLIDQNFSRRINAAAGVVINTGEDNYLTTADAVEQAPAVLASQFINERLALDAGLEDWQIGLGHAFEIDPELEDGLLYEIAQAAGGARDLPGRAAQVHAADEAHDRQRLPRLPAERALRADLGRDRPVHPPARDADGGAAHAASCTTAGSPSTRRARSARTRAICPRRSSSLRTAASFAAPTPSSRRPRRSSNGWPREGSSRRSRTASSRTRAARSTAAAATRASSSGTRTTRTRSWRRGPAPPRGRARRSPRATLPSGPTATSGTTAWSRCPSRSPWPSPPSRPRPPSATSSQMGIRDPYVTLAEAIAPDFTFFVVYGRATHEMDLSAIAAEDAPRRRSRARRSTRRSRGDSTAG